MQWTDDKAKQAIEALKTSYSLTEAATKLGVGYDSLRHALRSRGLQAGQFLRSSPQAAKMADVEIPERTKVESGLVERKLRAEVSNLKEMNANLLTELQAKIDQFEFAKEIKAAEEVKVVSKRRPGDKQREATAVLLCSDWHVEEKVDPKTVNGFNEYNLDISGRCIERTTEAFEWLIRDKRFCIREAIVWLGGDIITGYIHEELVESNYLSPVQAVLFAQERIERMIRTWLKETNLERIVIPCSFGNHGRSTLKMRVSTAAANSYEWLMYKSLEARFADEPRVRFEVASGYHTYIGVYDQMLRFHHGDNVQYQGGVGGLLIPLNKAIAQWQKARHADIDNLGHFHTYTPLPNVVVNGSLIGFGPYSLKIKAAYEPRKQAFYLLDRTRGKTMDCPVWYDGLGSGVPLVQVSSGVDNEG